MKIENYKIKSDFDSLEIDILSYQVDNPKALIAISHGMAEHKERYIPFMEFFSSLGYSLCIHDHRGHGESVRSNDDLGFFNDESANAIVEDLAQVIEFEKGKNPNVPVILLGHSMGSMVVRKYLKKYDNRINALIVCGSPSYNPMCKLAIALINTLEVFKGKHHRSNLIQNLAFGTYNKGIEGEYDERWISYNQENVKNYHEHQKDGFIFTLNGFKNLFTLMKDIYSKDHWALKQVGLPILFIAGEDDPVIISASKFNEAQDFLRQLGYQDVKGILYPKMRHEIFNETEHQLVFDDIAKWLKENNL